VIRAVFTKRQGWVRGVQGRDLADCFVVGLMLRSFAELRSAQDDDALYLGGSSWQAGHQKVVRALGACLRRAIGVPHLRQGSPLRL
jgi:hypothetical protein